MSDTVERLDASGCLSSTYSVEEVYPSYSGDQEGGFSGGLAIATRPYRIATIVLALTFAQSQDFRVVLARVGLTGQLAWRPAVPPGSEGVTSSMETFVGTLDRPVSIAWDSVDRYTAQVVLREDL